MYDAGADIVYHAAGGSGIGVFQAAAASDKRAIGVDSDQYQTVDDPALQAVIMTSMLKRVDNAVQAFIGVFVDGNVEGGADVVNDLESDGVGLATPVGSSTTSRPRSTTTASRSSTATSRFRPPVTPRRGSAPAGPRPLGHPDGGSGRVPGPAVVCPGRAASAGPGVPPGRRGATSCGQPFRRTWCAGPGQPATTVDPVAADATTTCAAHPVDAPEGEAHHGRNRRHRRQPPQRAATGREAPVRRRAARHHQALPRRRRQPGHRAAGPPRRGARDRRRERRRQVDADEDALRRCTAPTRARSCSTAAR